MIDGTPVYGNCWVLIDSYCLWLFMVFSVLLFLVLFVQVCDRTCFKSQHQEYIIR